MKTAFELMVLKAGFGGGCHWCTEAIFASLAGVISVRQGWISSDDENAGFSEAVIVAYDPLQIPFQSLIEIHLYTHSSTSNHSMRGKHRSAIYYFNEADRENAVIALNLLQANFENEIITKVLPFVQFRLNSKEYLNYYYTDPTRPFCELYINPKLNLLIQKFSHAVNPDRLKHMLKEPEI